MHSERRHCCRLGQQVTAVERRGSEESNAKLEHEICRHCEESGSAMRVITSSERLANQMKINDQ